MRPQIKAALLTSAGIFTLAALLVVFSRYVLLESYTNLETRHVRDDVHRATLHLESEIESLQRQVEDWAIWDESYAFVQNPDRRFITRNLSAESFHRLQINAVAFADQTGRIVYSATLDNNNKVSATLPHNISEILTRQSPLLSLKQGHRGVYLLPTGPILISSEPVFDSAKRLPVCGVMIMCRDLSAELINKLETLTQLTLSLQPITSDTLPYDFRLAKEQLLKSAVDVTLALSDSEIGGYSLVRDIAGRPTLILRAKTNRDFYREGLTTIRHFILWLCLAALFAGGLIIWLFNKVTLARDENLENEKIWQFALEGSGDGVWDWNVQTDEMFFSDRFQDILGYDAHAFKKSREEWSQRIHPEDLQTATEAFEKIRSGRISSCSFEHRLRNKNGDYRWIFNRGKVIRRKTNGKPARITGTITDTTERRLMEEQIFKAQKLESVGILAGGIAHDFNNILTAMIGYTSLARIYLEVPNKALKALEEAEKASHRATELTRQLLTFAKGGNPMKQCVSTAHLLHESVSLALRGTKTKGTCSISEHLYIDADEEQMSQAFRNIILNAAQAMPNGGEILIEAKEIPLEGGDIHELPPGPYIMISFSDQGGGISPDILDKIFDPFFTTKSGCTGLGLSTAYSIIRKHGGSIEVHSVAGAGTTVTLHIPSSGKECGELSCLEEMAGNIPHCTGHILVMDDEEMIRNLSAELLSLLGYQVYTCSSGEEAIDMYKTALEIGNPLCAVIMDLTIPGGMGGKEAAQSILAIDPAARLIVSSGYSNDPVLAEYSKYGFVAAVSKPYTADKLMAAVGLIGQQR
ncbi:MAG: CHASE4 domain-containing protein [Geobacteraceae bacterium]